MQRFEWAICRMVPWSPPGSARLIASSPPVQGISSPEGRRRGRLISQSMIASPYKASPGQVFGALLVTSRFQIAIA